MKSTYSAILRQSRAKLSWVAECPERKKSAFGNTPEEALEKLKKAIKIDSFALMKFAILSECEQARRNLQRKPYPNTQEWKLYRGEELWCDSELLKLLNQCSAQKNCTTWNQWRNNPKNNNLTVWLQGAKLKDVYLEDACLEDIHFESAELENVNFKNATLNSAFFSAAILKRCSFEKSELPYVKFKGAVLSDVSFENARLWGACFKSSSLQRTYFEDAHLKEVNFCNMTFSGDICFNKADLSKADFENVQGYGGLSFVEAVMWEASFKGANLSRANFKKTQFSFANFEKARLQDANFENAQGRYGCFREADLWGASFKEGDLAGSCFDGAHMRAANLQRTQLIDWQPEEGYPKGCSFIRANLMGAQLSGSDFRYQDLRGAMLRYITFDSQTFFEYCGIDDKTDFTMVNLDSANIHPSLLTTLKVNIRRSTWEDYFKKNKGLFALFMKFFWWISDYGSSTKRILCVFFTTAFFFALLYGCLDIIYPGILKGISPKTHCAMWLSQIIAFSLATMVTLGFGGININFVIDFPKASVFANVLVVCNLLSGYFLLAVLVTRIGFLFGTLAPELDINVQSDQE